MAAAEQAHGRGAGRGGKPLDLAGLFLGLWALAAPQPYGLCITVLALTPLICLAAVALAPEQLTLNSRRGPQARHSVGGPFLMSLLALGARGAIDVHLLAWPAALAAAAGLALLIAAAAMTAEIEFRRPIWIALLPLLGLTWGWGLLVELDSLFDGGPRASYPATVLDKSVSRGRSSTSYYLTVEPGAIPGGPGRLAVSRELYRRASVGAKVCAEVSPGRLGWAWYEVKACS